MAASKKRKIVRQREQPKGKTIAAACDPEAYYHEHPSWNFNSRDVEMWPFDESHAAGCFWNLILPKLMNFERMLWKEILVDAKKQNHSIPASELNPVAQRRLDERMIEAESIISLRLEAKIRLYGHMKGAVFNLLWLDLDHGDNDTCVCRSVLKHT